jgi:alkylated DNA nucleotide flippase Atl1
MPLFEVDKQSKRVVEIKPTTFPALKLWERQDLEAWVMSAPELAGGDFTLLTSEFDRFDRTSERLDVLGIVRVEPGHGRLVVVELKRDGTSTTVDLQAIKYAAYVAAVNFGDVVDMYAAHHGVSSDDARAVLLELLGGTEDHPPLIDDTPRIVLVAGDFRAEVTTTVLWLVDNSNLDVRCVRLQPFAVGERILVHSEVIIPLPEAEQYRLGVQRKRREVERDQEQRARAGRLLPRLVDAEAITIGQVLYFRRDAVPGGAPAWSRNEPLYSATLVTGEGNRTLRWRDPSSGEEVEDSPSLLAARLLHRLGERTGEISSAGVNGMHYWTVDGEISLRDLGAEAGVLERSARHIDRVAMREFCRRIPRGRWTTYGNVAEAIGVPGAAQSVAGVIATDDAVENAHRVLRSTGRISPGWSASDGGGPDVARRRLEEEGVRFGPGDVADPLLRWDPQAAVQGASVAAPAADG